jgi:integrase/recombinase XerC
MGWDDEIRMWALTRELAGDSRETLRSRRSMVSAMARAMEGRGLQPQDVTQADLMEHLAGEKRRRKKDGNGPASVHGAMRSFWGWHAKEYGTASPMAGVPRPKVKIPRTAVLTDEQLAAVCRVTTGRDLIGLRNRFLILLLTGTGIRRAEACGIRLGDFTEGRAVVKVTGKTGTRVAVLGKATQLALHRYLIAREKTARTDALLITRSGEPLSPDRLHGVLAEIGQRAGVPGLRPHLLRHVWAHRVQSAGLDLPSILTLGGWSSAQQLTDRYGAALKEERAVEAARRLQLDRL